MSLPEEEEEEAPPHPHPRLCDFCNSSTALLYCNADSAKLCLNCDREVHSTNQLFKKHTRSLLCDGCNSAPSSIFCCTDSSVLCQNCDWESHSNFRGIHDRRPIEGFIGCPSIAELSTFLGLEDLGKKKLVFDGDNNEGYLDFLVWETPSVVSLDDLIVSNDSEDCGGHSFQAMGVPPLPKNRNAACGKHKEDIRNQLRQMARSEPDFDGCLEDLEPEDFEYQTQAPISVPSYEITSASEKCDDPIGELCGDDELFHFTSFIELNQDICATSSVVPTDSEIPQPLPKLLNTRERDSAVTRYKEKKKTRR